MPTSRSSCGPNAHRRRYDAAGSESFDDLAVFRDAYFLDSTTVISLRRTGSRW